MSGILSKCFYSALHFSFSPSTTVFHSSFSFSKRAFIQRLQVLFPQRPLLHCIKVRFTVAINLYFRRNFLHTRLPVERLFFKISCSLEHPVWPHLPRRPSRGTLPPQPFRMTLSPPPPPTNQHPSFPVHRQGVKDDNRGRGGAGSVGAPGIKGSTAELWS